MYPPHHREPVLKRFMPVKQHQAKENENLRTSLDHQLRLVVEACAQIETSSKAISSGLESTSSICKKMDKISWDAFGGAVFNEWYLFDLLDMELSPSDLGAGGFTNTTLKLFKHTLSRNIASHGLSSHFGRLCEKLHADVSKLETELKGVNVDHLPTSGLSKILTVVSAGTLADEDYWQLSSEIEAFLAARRKSSEASATSQNFLEISHRPARGGEAPFLMSLMCLNEDEKSGRPLSANNRSFAERLRGISQSPLIPSEAGGSHAHNEINAGADTMSYISLLERRVSANEALLASYQADHSSKYIAAAKDVVLSEVGESVQRACTSFRELRQSDAGRALSDLAKVDAYLDRQKRALASSDVSYNEFRAIKESDLRQNESQIQTTVLEIAALQRKLARLSESRRETVASLVQHHEAALQRQSMFGQIKIAAEQYRSLLTEFGRSGPSAIKYSDVVLECAQSCVGLLAARLEADNGHSNLSDDMNAHLRFVAWDQLSTVTTLLHNIDVALLHSAANSGTPTDGTTVAVDDIVCFTENSSNSSKTNHAALLSAITPTGGGSGDCTGGDAFDAPSPVSPSTEALRKRRSSLAVIHANMVEECRRLSVEIGFPTNLEVGFGELEGHGVVDNHPIIYFDLEHNCPRIERASRRSMEHSTRAASACSQPPDETVPFPNIT